MDSETFSREKHKAWLGTAKIPLDSLEFPVHESRMDNRRCETRLLKLFREQSCERYAYDNYITAVIRRKDLLQALQESNMTIESLHQSEPPFLEIPSGLPIMGLRGKHRWMAARKYFSNPADRWWTVLFFDLDAVSSKTLKFMSEEDDNSMPFYDGEVYYKIRTNELQSDGANAKKWICRIVSEWKQSDYNKLHQSSCYKPFCDALDLLLNIPVLLYAFQLGNLRRIFRMKCPEELAVSVTQVYNVWARLMKGFELKLTISDVEYLQGRSPRWSSVDRNSIEEAFVSGRLFPDICNERDRVTLKERVLATDTIIPSMRTFLENTKFLEPAAVILRGLLPRRFRGTIQQQLLLCYTYRDRPREHFWRSYQHLWLTALRIFPYITSFKPLQDRRGRRMAFVGNYWGFLAITARDNGFSSRQIDTLLETYPHYDIIPQPVEDPAYLYHSTNRWRLKIRCGMPSETAFHNTAPFLSLENIYRERKPQAGAAELTHFAVARDIFLSFFQGPGSGNTELKEHHSNHDGLDQEMTPAPSILNLEQQAASTRDAPYQNLHSGVASGHSQPNQTDLPMIDLPCTSTSDTIGTNAYRTQPVHSALDGSANFKDTEIQGHLKPETTLSRVRKVMKVKDRTANLSIIAQKAYDALSAPQTPFLVNNLAKKETISLSEYPSPVTSKKPSHLTLTNNSSKVSKRPPGLSIELDGAFSVPSGLPTSFPQQIEFPEYTASALAETEHINQWEKNVVKVKVSSSVKAAKERLYEANFSIGLYVLGSSPGEDILYCIEQENLKFLDDFLQDTKRSSWWYRAFEDDYLKTISSHQVHEALANYVFVVCGESESDLSRVEESQSPEI
ncbi:uncharacterized protein BP01DRAFT_361090 [Aspergillus saccharolyticus JOP 1030-1]|uniref:Uncharacterized protein n=1 Tax=Aspergillus saccharolyticus JOP 1030-1 TaxID=1450539 RepID=A0A318Z0S0_9EURO|nr:hypothetical protein BP01DRAFT_361090 [Aspergillus saccharolyticus JOP 1030-1]PYH40586.1 hypothetical protein BP01DRAFT_361090 [Aspergillus saccharolyticus JOP 1030-1]